MNKHGYHWHHYLFPEQWAILSYVFVCVRMSAAFSLVSWLLDLNQNWLFRHFLFHLFFRFDVITPIRAMIKRLFTVGCTLIVILTQSGISKTEKLYLQIRDMRTGQCWIDMDVLYCNIVFSLITGMIGKSGICDREEIVNFYHISSLSFSPCVYCHTL